MTTKPAVPALLMFFASSLFSFFSPGLAEAQQWVPSSGRALLQIMRESYACLPDPACTRWFTSLTFTQKTTIRTPAGTDSIATWYESIRYTPASGAQLRIDTGPPAAGNGVLYSGDSVHVFRDGKQVMVRPARNALVPLIEGVYVQPVAVTTRELEPTGVDLARPLVIGRWNDRSVWIAGASSASDSASPQFWVDTATKAVVRAIFSPVAGAPVMDMRLLQLEPVGNGWLATRCEFYIEGKLSQVEEYENWKADVALSPGLFDAATWATAPHWASSSKY